MAQMMSLDTGIATDPVPVGNGSLRQHWLALSVQVDDGGCHLRL